MSSLRFHHVFYCLMGLSALVAFVIPARYSSRLRPQIQVLFSPVSRPSAAVARLVSNRVSPPVSSDHRPDPDIRDENQQLRAENMRLQSVIAELTRRDHELGNLGSLKDLCSLTKVVGADSAGRDSLQISASTLAGIRHDMYVLYPAGLVGQIQDVSFGGAQVRLITDPSFRVGARFCRFENKKMRPLLISPVVIQGMGGGMMGVRSMLGLTDIGLDVNLKQQERDAAATLREGDYAIVDDTDCPAALQGWMIGTVSQISRRRDNRLMAQIALRPSGNLRRLTEVMVLKQ